MSNFGFMDTKIPLVGLHRKEHMLAKKSEGA